jgi:O-antigen ligase
VKKANDKKVRTTLDPTSFLSISAVLISLYFNPALADPFNSPKLWLLMVLGGWSIGYSLVLIRHNRLNFKSKQSIGIYFLIFLVVSMFISALLTESTFKAFFGEQQRRLGFLFYLFMAIFMMTASLFFGIDQISKLYISAITLGAVFSIYGLMQHTNNDFVSWDNPYNSIILTLGNPNYASALMSIIAILVFTYGIITKSFIRYLSFITGTILLILITLSNSRQGLISFGIGMGIVILIFTYLHSKKLGMLLSLAFMTISVLVIMAMLQFGPLVQYVYKNSVSIRGFYWRAGIEMLKSNLLTGVGVDSYGDYFRLVREKEYPLRYGFQIMSDNAHNVPIQIFATSGIFAGIAYLSLNIFIFICGVKALKKVSGKNKMAIAGIFGAWISFQAQSIISIDNVGVTIWGWLLGGVLVGLGLSQNFDDSIKNERINSRKNSTTIELKQKIFSSLLALVTFIGCSTLYQGEKLMYEIVSWVNLGPKSQPNEFYDAMNRFENAKLVEPAYKFRAANIWFQIGEVEKAEKSVLNLLEFDPNSYDYLNGCVQIYLNKSMWGPLISCSERIVEIDPFNAENYLILAQAYSQNNQTDQAITAYETILSFAKGKSQADQAEIELRKLLQK